MQPGQVPPGQAQSGQVQSGQVQSGEAPGLPAPGRCLVIGVLNVTPDSFSDGGAWYGTEPAVRHGLDLAAQGADLVDVGGESTRPGARRVPADEELRRVLPVISALAAAGVPVSVDTMRAEVAGAALAAGACLVNDVSGGLADPQMPRLVAQAGVAYVVMHWRGHSRDMAQRAVYRDVVGEVRDELRQRVDAIVAEGVDPSRIILDPGLGFAKNPAHNWALLTRLNEIAALGGGRSFPVLVGASRKSFLGKLLALPNGTARPFAGRDTATAAVTALAAAGGRVGGAGARGGGQCGRGARGDGLARRVTARARSVRARARPVRARSVRASACPVRAACPVRIRPCPARAGARLVCAGARLVCAGGRLVRAGGRPAGGARMSLDRVSLRGLRVRGRHGVYEHERRDGQDFVVDAVLGLDTRAAAAADDLSRTVDYGALAQRLTAVVAGEPVRLIETLADRLATVCLAEPAVQQVEITVHKPQAPLSQAFDDVTVTIQRRRA